MSSDPDISLISYQKNQAPFKLDAKEGVWPFIAPEIYFLPFPLTEDEYERLIYTFFLGDEVLTRGVAKEPEIDPQQDDVQISLRGKIMAYQEFRASMECCIEGPPGDPGGAPGQGPGIFDPPIETQPPDGSEPPGYPPGGGGGDDNPAKYHKPSGASGGHKDMLCADNKILNYHGTNHTGNFFDYGAPHNFANLGFGLLPVNDLLVDYVPIKDAIDAKIALNGDVPTNATVTAVYFEHSGNWCDSGHAGFFTSSVNGVESGLFNFRATRPHLKPVSGDNFSEIALKPTRLIQMADINVGGSWSDGIKFGLETVAALDEQEKYLLLDYDKIDEIFFFCRMPPTTPNIFFSNSDSPVFELCIIGIDYNFAVTKWTGHFNFENDGDLVENPYVTGQMVWFSDDPDGFVTGMVGDFVHDGDYSGGELDPGDGTCVLIDPPSSNGNAGTPSGVGLLGIADGYDRGIDQAYTNVHLRMRIIGGAQTVTLNIHRNAGGPGENFYASLPDTGHFSSTPYHPDWVELDFDISSMALEVGDVLFSANLVCSIYLYEWSITFS